MQQAAPTPTPTSAKPSFSVEPLTPTIGAEIGHIDLRKPLDSQTKTDLYAALLQWKVIFFRDQDLSTEQHLDFCRQFGTLEQHPFSACKPGYPEVLNITHNEKSRGRENVWHTDVTWRMEPSLGSVLRALQVPPVGGDTLFADMYAAYDGLKPAIKEKIDGKFALHALGFYERMLRKKGATDDDVAQTYEKFPRPEHPLVRTHPETGRKALYLHPDFLQHIVDMEPGESKALLEILYAQSRIPEYQCRFKWRKNSIAFWDNRATQHYAASDYWPQVRQMERVTVGGDLPFYRHADGSVSRSRTARLEVPA